MSNTTRAVAPRGALTTTALNLRLGGRNFGAAMEDSDRFEQSLPPFIAPIADEIRANSAILKLADNANEDAIYAAYKADIRMLQGRNNDFKHWIMACIKASVKPNKAPSDADTYFKTGWDFVQQHIPPMAEAPLIGFSAERAALPPQQLILELTQGVATGVENMMRRFCLWLDLLVTKEYVGLVQFTGPTVGHYFYFRPYTADAMQVDDKMLTPSYDAAAPEGQRTTYATTEVRHHRVAESVERHDHHIVKARTDTVADYSGVIPTRIIGAIEAAPDWLQPHLRIVSGDITMEVVQQRIVREHEEVWEVVTDVYKASPALAIGQYALDGWSEDDTRAEDSGFSRLQKAYATWKRGQRRELLIGMALLAVLAAVLTAVIMYLISSSTASSQATYDQYYARVTAGHEIYTLTKDKNVVLPKHEPLYLTGTGFNGQLFLSTDVQNEWPHAANNHYFVRLTESAPKTYYGTVDLGDEAGIPVKLNVVYADKDKVMFTVDYYIQPVKFPTLGH